MAPGPQRAPAAVEPLQRARHAAGLQLAVGRVQRPRARGVPGPGAASPSPPWCSTKLVIAGTGAYVLCRVLGLGPLAAAFGGTAFELSGPMIVHAGWPHTSVTCWAGWILAAVVGLLRGRHRMRQRVMLAVAVGFAVYGGHPESLVVMGVAVVGVRGRLPRGRGRRATAGRWSAPCATSWSGSCAGSGWAHRCCSRAPSWRELGAAQRHAAARPSPCRMCPTCSLVGLQGNDFTHRRLRRGHRPRPGRGGGPGVVAPARGARPGGGDGGDARCSPSSPPPTSSCTSCPGGKHRDLEPVGDAPGAGAGRARPRSASTPWCAAPATASCCGGRGRSFGGAAVARGWAGRPGGAVGGWPRRWPPRYSLVWPAVQAVVGLALAGWWLRSWCAGVPRATGAAGPTTRWPAWWRCCSPWRPASSRAPGSRSGP